MKKISNLKKIILILLILIITTQIVFLFIVFKNNKEDEKNIEIANKTISSLFQDEENKLPKMDIDNLLINDAYLDINKIKNKSEKEKLINKIENIKTFINIKNELYECFDDDVLLSTIDETKIFQINSNIEKLSLAQQDLLKEKVSSALSQLEVISNAKNKMKALFTDEMLTTIRENVTREEKNEALELMQQLPQTDILTDNQKYFDEVEKYISDKEEIERKRQAELARQRELARQQELARQAAIAKAKEEAIKKEQEEKRIQEAYVEISGISMINQKDNKVFNGCEAAALLMALKYKGYAASYDLPTFALEMPKHDTDPHQGFIYSIFDLAPTDVTHWIAPNALADFGSKFSPTTNVSGINGEQIKQYIDKNTPVIVYATYGFREPTKWIGEVPLNLHVMLVIGYNKITGAYVINDPWANKIIVKKENFEKIYNLMHYAVIVN